MERLHSENITTMSRPENYPGYPTERLIIDVDPQAPLQGMEIPDGPWAFHTTPLPSFEQSLHFINAGYQTDSLGRPLHPWAHTLLSSEQGGIVTGKGAYWNWGPNATADPIVITTEARPRILLIQRSDTGALALPGGFVDSAEDPYDTARRELQEETGLTIAADGQLVYSGPVADLRTTLHAWAETSAYVFRIDAPQPVSGNDDALNADWYYVDELPDQLFGSHAMLVQRALEAIRAESEPTSFQEILALPEHQRKTTLLQAGHMAYKHYTAEHKTIQLFVKEHDPTQFTDPAREAHSRAYLVKEHSVYTHLAAQGFQTIPQQVELIEDSVLAMESFSPDNGWHWRAPETDVSAYTEEVLAAFDALQQTSPLVTDHHDSVAPTYDTFWREGWDAIDDAALAEIRQKIAQFGDAWNEEQRSAARLLVDQLETLRGVALQLDRDCTLFPSHNDARQSNIAWHPTHGVKLVDWSWADAAPKDADATMFLIDLAKSGFTVNAYHQKINKDYALTLIGFWLAHSIWETRDENSKVREHQVASAAAAFQLIQSLPQPALVFSEEI